MTVRPFRPSTGGGSGGGPFRLGLAALLLLPLLACGDSDEIASAGCRDDGDCAEGRLCRDLYCVFSEQADRLEPAETVARQVVSALEQGLFSELEPLLPSEADLAYGFDFEEWERLNRREGLKEILRSDFSDWRDLGPWDRTTGFRFDPNRTRSIPAGSHHAKIPLDRLPEPILMVSFDGEEESELILFQLVRLRGRWRLFPLSNRP